jgi:hypothetical protein
VRLGPVWRSDETYIDYEAVAFALCAAHARHQGWVLVPQPGNDRPTRCVGSVHEWDDESAPDARCACGEYSVRDWSNPDISRVQFVTRK